MPIRLPRLSPSTYDEAHLALPNPPRMSVSAAGADALGAENLGEKIVSATSALSRVEDEKRKLEQTSTTNLLVNGAQREFADTKSGIDQTADHNTYALAVDAALRKITADWGKKTRDPVVLNAFRTKMDHWGVEQYAKARVRQDSLFKDYHEGVLVNTLNERKRQIVDVARTDGFGAAIGQLAADEKTIDQYRALIGEEKVTKQKQAWREATGGTLAQLAMRANPMGFLPKEEGGDDGWRQFERVTDPKYLGSLMEQAGKEFERRVKLLTDAEEKAGRKLEASMKSQAHEWRTRMLQRFDDPNPANRPTRESLDDGFAMFGSVLSMDEVTAMQKLLNRPREEGGVTDPAVKHDLQMRIVLGDPRLTTHSIARSIGSGLSAKDGIDMLKFFDERQDRDDVSKHPLFQSGVRQITVHFAGRDVPGFMTEFMIPREDRVKYADTLYQFEQIARSLQRAGKPLTDLVDIARKLAKDAQARGANETAPSTPPAATGSTSPKPAKPAPHKKSAP